jgi:hypothetical protein
MREKELLWVATDLLSVKNRTQSHIRRAISTSYYAVFSRLCEIIADALCGAQKSEPTRAWVDVYRAVGHTAVGKTLRDGAAKRRFGNEFSEFSELFERLRNLRYDADYDPVKVFRLSEVDEHMDVAALAIRCLNDTTPDDRQAVAIALFIRARER